MCGWRWKRVEVKSSILDVLSQRINKRRGSEKQACGLLFPQNVHVQAKSCMCVSVGLGEDL